MCTKFKKIFCSLKKKLLRRADKMANIKNENSKIWSEEAIATFMNCFQSHECLWNVISGDYKDQNKRS